MLFVIADFFNLSSESLLCRNLTTVFLRQPMSLVLSIARCERQVAQSTTRVGNPGTLIPSKESTVPILMVTLGFKLRGEEKNHN